VEKTASRAGEDLLSYPTFVLPLIVMKQKYTGLQTLAEIKEELKNRILDSVEFKALFDYSLAIKPQLSMLNLFNTTYISYMNNTLPTFAFGPTRDQLKVLFDAYRHRSAGGGSDNPAQDNYQDPAIAAYGGASGISEKMRKNLEAMTCMDLQGLFNLPMVNFGAVLKLFLETPGKIFKGLTEFFDPNIAIASKIAFALRLGSCIEIPVGAVSMALQPANVMPSSWFGPPLTPLGIVYLLMGMGFSFSPMDLQNLLNGLQNKPQEGKEEQKKNVTNVNPYTCNETEEE
jgi:hypothetical protein